MPAVADGPDGAAGEAGASVALASTLAPVAEKPFLPRIIHFVPASSSAPQNGLSVDPDTDGPVPPYYLYPRHRFLELCASRAPRRVGRGLSNAGNTCFFNSVLQTVCHIVPLQNYLLSKEHTSACSVQKEGGMCALCLLEEHTHEVLKATSAALHPKALLLRIKQLGGKNIQLGRQEDAHEFLLHFLDACHRAALQHSLQGSVTVPTIVKRTTLIHQLFGGYLRSQVTCLECKHVSNTFDPFLDLSLEVRNVATLEKALEGFTKSETITGPVRYKCRRCQHPVDVTKRFSIDTPPHLMVFQLKRFEFSQGSRGKIVKPVTFGPSLDLARFTSNPEVEAEYRLYGVIVHSGQSAKSGHYFTFIRHSSGGWYQFNDEVVRAASEQQVLRQQAYLLFYEAAIRPAADIGPQTQAVAAPESVNSQIHGLSGTAKEQELSGDTNGASSPQPSTVFAEHKMLDGDASQVSYCGSGKSSKLQTSGLESAAGNGSQRGSSRSVARSSLNLRSRSNCTWRRRLLCLHSRRVKRRRLAGEASQARCQEVVGKNLLLGSDAAVEKRAAPPAAHMVTIQQPLGIDPDHNTQYGLAGVDSWEEDALMAPKQTEAFRESQRRLQPGPDRRDELDAEYDVGKRKHKPKTGKASVDLKGALDQVQVWRMKSLRRPKTSGKGGGKASKGAGKSSGKGDKGFKGGKGRGRSNGCGGRKGGWK